MGTTTQRTSILIIAPDFKPIVGGVSEYVHQLALSLERIGLEVIVFNSSFKAKDFRSSYRVVRNNISTTFGLRWCDLIERRVKYVCQLVSIIIVNRPGVILLSRFSRTAIVDMIIARLLRKQFILFIHGREIFESKGRLKTVLMKVAQQGANLIITNSEYTRQLARQYCSRRKKIETLLPGINLEDFTINEQIAPAVELIRTKYVGKKVVLFCGRLVMKKGLANLLLAFEKVVAIERQARLVVMGGGPEGKGARLITERRGMSEYVEFVGLLEGDMKIAYFHACDLFVLPSIATKDDIESFGIVGLEAAACRKPVVGGNSGGIPEAVLHGRTGILVDATCIDDLAEGIIKVLSSKELALRLGENGYMRVRDGLTWSMQAVKLVGYLEECKGLRT